MLAPIIIKKDSLSPKVVLDQESGVFCLSGKSIVENAHDFYTPILNWFKEYFKKPNKSTHLIFYIEYLNSSSALQISNLIFLFSENKKGNQLKITWLYDEDDEAMKETGKEFQYSNTLKFDVKKFNAEEFDLEF
ncbi:MAG: DUF1987 domain-containing protein [Bacteroidales bacterium]|nr:DUF1987 domain-containing protein [Bacteroidales bacterium]